MAKKRAAERDHESGVETTGAGKRLRAPMLPYRPQHPVEYRPNIGIIGCGGIVPTHLKAYRKARFRVTALADPVLGRAEEKRDKYYPRARAFESADQLLALPDIDIVDITTHPEQRVELIKAAISAGKHILSQKPFTTDLDVGRKLVALAKRKGVKLAVNQNGRWAPHVSYAREAIGAGLLGEVSSVDVAVHWDHNGCAGTSFDQVPHLALFDFGIHWFDMVHCYFGNRKPRSVFAATCRSRSQRTRPPLLAHSVVEFARGQASLVFRGDTCRGSTDRTVIVGSQATLISNGSSINEQNVTIHTDQGWASPRLTTQWFPDGFAGTMGELMCAIEQDREPSNSARDNLHSLALCFAALQSADSGRPVKL